MKIGLDIGHGNSNRKSGVYDPGACAGGVAEADIALAWGLTCKHVLTQAGFDVWMSRDDDRDPNPISTRDERAERAGCDILISFHCNAGGSAASGTESFYRDAADKALAEKVNRACLVAMGGKNRGVKHESKTQHPRLAVMGFDGACALLEIGFVTNSADRRKMLSRDTRIAFANALVAELKGE